MKFAYNYPPFKGIKKNYNWTIPKDYEILSENVILIFAILKEYKTQTVPSSVQLADAIYILTEINIYI